MASDANGSACPTAADGAAGTAASRRGTLLSVVVPVYKGEAFLEELHRRVVAAADEIGLAVELVLVDDAGPDRSWEIIERLAAADPRVRGFALTRNFGQHHAISAGLQLARGDWVVVMDCDLQDPPEEIPNFHRKALEGYECVLGRRALRRDPPLKRFSSWLFYRVFNYLTDLRLDGTVANFSIISRRVVDEFNRLGEAVRFYGGFLHWMGFRTAYIDVRHEARSVGTSSYSLLRLLQLSANFILAYSNKPLRLCVTAGLLMSAASFIAGLVFVFWALFFGIPVMGWASLIISIYFGTGMTILTLGILGLYVDRIFTEVKRRPLFVIGRTTTGLSARAELAAAGRQPTVEADP